MPFPLPLDPTFRKEVIESWLQDVEDRIEMGDLEGAKVSWHFAQGIYISLPPGFGDGEIESKLMELRVKFE